MASQKDSEENPELPRPRATRTKLPGKMKQYDLNIWGILKQTIGKDLSKIAMPVQFNEPLSFLQRTAEYAEYNHLLRIVSVCENAVERMEYAVAFAVSATCSSVDRLRKPFNPLEGETFELCRSEVGMRFYAEQVSHHPPTTAFHCELPGVFTYHGTVEPKTRFVGKHIEVIPKGFQTLHVPNFDEYYTWQCIPFFVRNIISGKLWVEVVGQIEITNHKSGHKATIHFRKATWTPQGKEAFCIDGYISDRNGAKLRAIYGKWNEAVYSVSVDQWEKHVAEQKILLKSCKRGSMKNTGETKRCPSSTSANVDKAKAANGNSAAASTAGATKAAANRSEVNGEEEDEEEEEEPPSWPPLKYDLNLPGQALLWQATERSPESIDYYNFSNFTMMLNEIGEQEALGNLPPTDARFRPDIRMLENGDIEGADMEKRRLEDKQRERRKMVKKGIKGIQVGPLWFSRTINPQTGKEDWTFNRSKYLERDWSNCPQLF